MHGPARVWMNPDESVLNIPGSGSALTTRESISGRNLGHSPEADAIGDKERNATASWPTESDVLIVLVVVVLCSMCVYAVCSRRSDEYARGGPSDQDQSKPDIPKRLHPKTKYIQQLNSNCPIQSCLTSENNFWVLWYSSSSVA